MRAFVFATVALLALGSQVAYSCPGGQHEECINVGGLNVIKQCGCFPDHVVPDVNPVDVVKAAIPGAAVVIEAARRSGDSYLQAAAQNVDAVGAKLDKEMKTAISNAFTNPTKGVQDLVQTHIKAANDFVEAASATVRFAERSVNGYGDVLSAAERRLREGKVIDAVWHLHTDKFNADQENAAKYMQDSETARQAAQVAASTYGGPAGAAAFAAWMAYNSSGKNVEAALRAGAYTYLVSTGYSQVGSMPSNTVPEVLKKAAAIAAVRGMAVAAAGGSKEDILNAAKQGAGAIIIQAGQAYVTKEYTDSTKAKADTFCMESSQNACGDAKRWLKDAKKRVDEYKAKAEQVPNTMLTDDGRWAVSWDKKGLLDRTTTSPNTGTAPPSVVVTYVGDGSPYKEQILILAAIGEPEKFQAPHVVSTSWIAIRDVGAADYFFWRVSQLGADPKRLLTVGDILKARRSVYVRPGPDGGGWGTPIDVVTEGQKIRVLEVSVANTSKGRQEWIRFEYQ